ncbi:DUF5753 domain-containing protein [Plantactinospora sp. KLBMP9567]|uniref:DUF5753 domain-containing protein n=1 Tax=Plantactinospora sp. KLBMP9567 TaxID=3085900 RepID=UPI002980EBCB|nr:DUF5753 domain-containing protein [Plantactinospora sp. KLBMP9567]MDW5328608.1 DUF5753 domain-containing protein [Plantactinospora sp. KLBMP9567]
MTGHVRAPCRARCSRAGARAPGRTLARCARLGASQMVREPPTLSAIIGEFALTFGPPEVRRKQLQHLLELSQRSKVQVLVVPRSAGLHSGLQGAFVLATLPASRRAGYVDDQLQGRVVTDGGDLDQLEVSWEIVSGLALPVQPSRDLLQRAITDHD